MNATKRHPTIGDLKTSRWWWHHCRFAFAKEPVLYQPPQNINSAEWRDWRDDGMERIAQGWELVRRVRHELQWPPFYDIGRFVAGNLRVRIIPEYERSRSSRMITTATLAPGWTDEGMDDWRFNLGLTKDALRRQYATQFLPTEQEVGEFLQKTMTFDELRARIAQRKRELPSIAEHLRWIDAQAKAKGVKLPRGMIGQRNRPPSWALVEILDIARYVATPRNPDRKLSSAERKMKTVASQKGKSLAGNYIAAMEEIRKLPGYLRQAAPEAIARDRRILLGTWIPPQTNW
jgi:hypothetical protein